jgi:hypothetical protein
MKDGRSTRLEEWNERTRKDRDIDFVPVGSLSSSPLSEAIRAASTTASIFFA